MMTLVLACLMSNSAKLYGAELQLCDNVLAMPWKENIVYPGQTFAARYRLPPPEQLGQELTMSYSVISATGQQVMRMEMPKQHVKPGNPQSVFFVMVQLPQHLEAGDYQLCLLANGSDKKLELKQPLHVKPNKLAFVATNMTYDMEGKVPVSPNRLTVTQTFYLKYSVTGVGTEKNTSKIDAECEVRNEADQVVQVIKLPEDTQPALPVPGEKTVVRSGYFNFMMSVPGKYRLRVKVMDKITWDAVTKEFAVQYHLPE